MGEVTYRPPAGFVGVDDFVYSVEDPTTGIGDVQEVHVIVGNAPVPPIINPDAVLVRTADSPIAQQVVYNPFANEVGGEVLGGMTRHCRRFQFARTS